SLEHYLSKFEYEYERQAKTKVYGLPTWTSLVTERKKIPGRREWSNEPIADDYRHVKYPILLALWQRGLVLLTEKQAEKLKQIVENQAGKPLSLQTPRALKGSGGGLRSREVMYMRKIKATFYLDRMVYS
ncbi:MAG: hypothetical protein DRJ69_06720, partial [Thermoprotei archaeon]